MKSFVKYSLMACIAFAMTSCVQDLNTSPIDPYSSTSFNQERMFTKCYACLGLIGQSVPGDDSDVEDMNAGMSGFYRTIWYCNELSTDEAWWIWDNPESNQLVLTDWDGTNTMMSAIYTRLVLDIKYCNHYLAYASSETDEDKWRRAEVRFIRALHYFYFMDMFLYVPYVETESNEYPHYIPRHELYKILVNELTELESALPDRRRSKYRVGKSAAQLLLARIYLNADVYNKYNPDWTPGQTWELASETATRLIEENRSVHELVTESAHAEPLTDTTYVYSAYQRLFMGDNHREDVAKEAILLIYQDALYGQSYAGSTMLVAGPRMTGLNPCGIEALWQSMRTSPTMVDKFIEPAGINREQAEAMVYDEFEMPKQLKDDRAILCSNGLNTGSKFQLRGDRRIEKKEYLFDCWVALKFTGVYSTAVMPKHFHGLHAEFPDTDVPLMRLAEAYLIRAEAKARKSGNWNDALADVKVIRDRANAVELTSMDEETMLDEWCREFYYEGRRRIDLIRFGRFFGPESDEHKYHWEGRMNKDDGERNFVSGTPEYKNWFPIPSDDKRENPNYKTDVEGDPNNQFASRGGDGYPY